MLLFCQERMSRWRRKRSVKLVLCALTPYSHTLKSSALAGTLAEKCMMGIRVVVHCWHWGFIILCRSPKDGDGHFCWRCGILHIWWNSWEGTAWAWRGSRDKRCNHPRAPGQDRVVAAKPRSGRTDVFTKGWQIFLLHYLRAKRIDLSGSQESFLYSYGAYYNPYHLLFFMILSPYWQHTLRQWFAEFQLDCTQCTLYSSRIVSLVEYP